ncbi:probable cytochrome P450 6d5 [Schistocerca nitens]|uniref:probable cytochrome P450 6d5 n=1 Tax=Schistocerca nitens TaxID=7011 RepID=UPI002117C0FD|nr:probable cytochrome P450 6d5 [Schistocerca nitens]
MRYPFKVCSAGGKGGGQPRNGPVGGCTWSRLRQCEAWGRRRESRLLRLTSGAPPTQGMQWLPGATASEPKSAAAGDRSRGVPSSSGGGGVRLEFFLPLALNIASLFLVVVTLAAAPALWSAGAVLSVAAASAWWFSYWRRRGVPQLWPLPPYGDGWGCVLLARDIGAQLSRLCSAAASASAPVLGVYLLWRPVLLARSPQAAAAALRALHDHGLAANVPPPRGLFHQAGGRWRRSRELLVPAFSGTTLRAIFQQTLQPAAERLGRRLASSSSRSGATVADAHRLASDFAAEVIAEAVLGLRRAPGDADHPALEEVRAWSRRRLRPSLWHFLPTALSFMAPRVAGLLPKGPVPPPDFLHIVRRVAEANAEVGDCAPRRDIATHLQKLRDEGLMSGVETSVHAMLMFSGAMEATASALAYCLLEVALNPEVQRRLRAELRAAGALQGAGRRLPFDALAGLPYLHCVVHETLRKHPPLAMLNREVGQEAAEASAQLGCRLEPGTAVVVPLAALHRDPRLFPQPHLFLPERFTPEEAQRRHPCAYLPFGGGPRTCIGKRLGLLLMKAAVSEVVLRCHLQPCPWTAAQPAAEPWAPVLVPQGGIWLRFSSLRDGCCDDHDAVAGATSRPASSPDEAAGTSLT